MTIELIRIEMHNHVHVCTYNPHWIAYKSIIHWLHLPQFKWVSKPVYPSLYTYKHTSRLCIYTYHVTLFFTDYCDRATCYSDIPSDSYRGGIHGGIFIWPGRISSVNGRMPFRIIIGTHIVSWIYICASLNVYMKCMIIYIYITHSISFMKYIRFCIYT